MNLYVLLGVIVLLCCSAGFAADPNLRDAIERPLRYRPDGRAFVIENGDEFFNRPLYAGNTAFRIDAGDKPEFSFYLPGRGGVVRLGVRAGEKSIWLKDARSIITRYEAGAMRYEIRDPMLAEGAIHITAIGLREVEGLGLRVEPRSLPDGSELIVAYGGANGERHRRDGDIGTDRVPMSRYFQLRPDHCIGSRFQINDGGFEMRSGNRRIAGILPSAATPVQSDAAQWDAPNALLSAAGYDGRTPVAVARIPLAQRVAIAVQNLDNEQSPLRHAELDRLFDRTIEEFDAIASQVVVETPDQFINAAASAICVAADGIWDERQQAFMHGAVAWRRKLLGWRGLYAGDALGRHDRTRAHLSNWTSRQNTNPVDPSIRGADPEENLARSERMLHSNGDMTNSHYDMNLVAVDAMFRHILWTGDLEYARQMWPVIERHIAWERRLFRREFGDEKLPLYEGYACIWASDDLQYHGGGAAHSTAYNHWHNLMAARIAEAIGEDPAPYRAEADLIARAMRELLWVPRGWYAEFKDYLGLQLVHPGAALWSYYHAIDSETADPRQAWQFGRYVETELPHIPVKGAGVPNENLHAIATTTWMPYTYSINNVVMAEMLHTSLADWQARRPEHAFATFKGAILDGMYLGLCPGNIGMATGYDANRRESQRDFADGVGIATRALVEGLFGIRPDALAGEVVVAPGFPKSWDTASIRHPDITSRFTRENDTDRFAIEPRFARPLRLKLRISARRTEIAEVTVNGAPGVWRNIDEAVGEPMIEIDAPPAERWEIAVRFAGPAPAVAQNPAGVKPGGEIETILPGAMLIEVIDPQQALSDVKSIKNSFAALANDVPGHRTVFAKVRQGDLSWQIPIEFEIASEAAPAPVDWSASLADDAQLEPIDLSGAWNDKVTNIFRNEYVSPRSPFCSLAMPIHGLGAWSSNRRSAEIDDSGLREAAARNDGRFITPQGLVFNVPPTADAKNIAFVSQWDNYPDRIEIPLSGSAKRLYLLMAGSTNHMQSRLDNGEVVVFYTDGTSTRLPLRNPTTWWPIEQDYFIDDFAFAYPGALPPRVDLKTGTVRVLETQRFKGQGKAVPGGAATILDLPLDPGKSLHKIELRALANEVVIGLMSATLERP